MPSDTKQAATCPDCGHTKLADNPIQWRSCPCPCHSAHPVSAGGERYWVRPRDLRDDNTGTADHLIAVVPEARAAEAERERDQQERFKWRANERIDKAVIEIEQITFVEDEGSPAFDLAERALEILAEPASAALTPKHPQDQE